MRVRARCRATVLMLATSVPLLAPPRDAGAANKSWVGTSGNWTTTTNWAPVGMPISVRPAGWTWAVPPTTGR